MRRLNKKENKAITLVALVITIIILLILAGVTIGLAMNGNGLFEKSKLATEKYNNEVQKEETEFTKYSNEIDSYVDGNRGTVTLTEQEYAMFKSQFSKNGNVLISKPSTWTVGTEYDFGDGIYGQRFTGTLSVVAKNYENKTIAQFNNRITLLNCGGFWQDDNNGEIASLGSNHSTGVYSGIVLTASNELKLLTQSSALRTNAPYDVWVLYKKL